MFKNGANPFDTLPTRLGTDKPVSVPAISRFVSIPMRVGCWHLPVHLKTEHVRQLCNAFTGLPTRLETDLPTQIAKRGKSISPGPAIPMRLGNNNVTHFLLFDKWGKP